MSLVQPAWLALLPLVVPLVLAFHAQRRRDLPVASLVVWRRVHSTTGAAPRRRRIPWQDPRLWLQLLAVTVAVLALARPVIGANGRVLHWIVVIDGSTSMNAIDVAPSRFEAAIADVRARWGSQPRREEVSIVQTVGPAPVVAARWPVGSRVASVLDGLAASHAPADWVAAARRVRTLAASASETRVVVYTDAYGAEPAHEALAAAGILPGAIDVIVRGDALVNVGVGNVDARLRGERADQWTLTGRVETVGLDPGELVRIVASYRPFGQDTFLPWGGVDVTLGAGGSAEFEIPLDLPGPGEVEVRGPSGDRLSVDDRAIVSLRPEPVRVVIIGPSHPALLRALAAIGDLEVFQSETIPEPSDVAPFDLAIVTIDSDIVPATSTLWFGGVPPDVMAGAELREPLAPMTTSRHHLVQDLDPVAMGLTRAQPLRSLEGATPLIIAGDETLAWARTTNLGRQVVLGFGPDDGAWPAQLSFPAFVAALVDWASPKSWTHVPGGCQVGQACSWPRDAFAGDWVLKAPSGDEVRRPTGLRPVTDDPLADAVWDETWFDAGFVPDLAGRYELVLPNDRVGLPVAVRPIGGEGVAPNGATPGTGARSFSDLGSWLAWLALALVVADAIGMGWAPGLGLQRRAWGSLASFGLVIVAWSMVGLGLPFPWLEAGGEAVWVGPHDAPEEAFGVRSSSAGWRWSAVGVQTIGGVAEPDGGAVAAEAIWAGDIASALEIALALPADAPERRVVVSGGAASTLTASEVVTLTEDASRAGMVVDVVVAPSSGSGSTLADASTPPEQASVEPSPTAATSAVVEDPVRVQLDQVEVPDAVRAGARFSLRAVVRAPAGVAWRWQAERSDAADRGQGDGASQGSGVSDALDGPVAAIVRPSGGEPTAAPEPTKLATATGTGTGVAEIELQAGGPGDLQYRLTLQREGGASPDAEASITVPVGDRLRVLMVATDERQGVRLGEALAAQSIDVDRVTPYRMPSSLDELGDYDAVALVNVPAQEMFTAYQEMLLSYVRDLGGGLAIFGGPSTYGPGGYFRTALEELSPLSAQITDDAPEVAMAFVLDRSGSMNGVVGDATRMDVAKVATLEALGMLGDKSRAAIVVFDAEAQVLLPLRPVEEIATFREVLSSVTAAGGTSIFPGLVAAYDLMRDSESATRHVVVMTDGLSQEADFATVLGALGEIGVTTSFVGVGDAADRRQLATLANLSGGALHMALDFGALPGILAQEAMMLSAQPIEERVTRGDWVTGSLPAFLKEVATDRPPLLQGYVRTTAKDEAVVHLVERSNDDPLMASWRYGLGRVVAFASEADGPWVTAWTEAPDFARIWSQTLRWTAERPIRAPGTLQTTAVDGVLDVILGVPIDATADEVAKGRIELLAEGAEEPVGTPLRLVAAGRAAARFAFADDWSGAFALRVPANPSLGIEATLERAYVWPLPRAQALRPDSVNVERLAAYTGGDVLASGSVGLAPVAPRWGWQSRPEVWWLLGLVAFLVGLALRYGVAATWSDRLRGRAAT